MNGKHTAGKGSKYRKVDMEKYRQNFDAIFDTNKKKSKTKTKKKDSK